MAFAWKCYDSFKVPSPPTSISTGQLMAAPMAIVWRAAKQTAVQAVAEIHFRCVRLAKLPPAAALLFG